MRNPNRKSSKNTNPTFRTFLPFGTFPRQSITKIQSKDREQPPVEKNYTNLYKVLSELFRLLVKNYLLLFLVVFSSFKVIPSLQKVDYHSFLIGSARKRVRIRGKDTFLYLSLHSR